MSQTVDNLEKMKNTDINTDKKNNLEQNNSNTVDSDVISLKFDHDKIKENARNNNELDKTMEECLNKASKYADSKEEEGLNQQMLEEIFGSLHKNPVKCYHFVSYYFNEMKKRNNDNLEDTQLLELLETDLVTKAKFSYDNHHDIQEIQKILDDGFKKFFKYQNDNLSPVEKNLLPLLVLSPGKVSYNSFHPKTCDRIKIIAKTYLIKELKKKVDKNLQELTQRVIDFWKIRMVNDKEEFERFSKNITTEDVGIWIIVDKRDFLNPKLI